MNSELTSKAKDPFPKTKQTDRENTESRRIQTFLYSCLLRVSWGDIVAAPQRHRAELDRWRPALLPNCSCVLEVFIVLVRIYGIPACRSSHKFHFSRLLLLQPQQVDQPPEIMFKQEDRDGSNQQQARSRKNVQSVTHTLANTTVG